MEIVIVILFIFFSVQMWTASDAKGVSNRKMALIVILLSLVAAFRPETMRDYAGYRDLFLTGRDDHVEIGFKFLSNIIRNFTSIPWLYFFIIALISVGLKIKCVFKQNTFIYASILVYISTIYILQDLIAIRAAIASGLGLLALNYKIEGNWKVFVCLILLGSFIHTSCFLFLPLWFLRKSRLLTKVCIVIILLSYVLALQGLTFGRFVELVNVEYVQKMWTYYMLQDDTPMNIYSVKHLLNVLVCILLLTKIDAICKFQPSAPIYIYTYSISVAIFVLFSDVQVISVRISELYQVCQIVCIPMLLYIYHSKRRKFGYFLISAFSFCQLFLSVFYSDLVS